MAEACHIWISHDWAMLHMNESRTRLGRESLVLFFKISSSRKRSTRPSVILCLVYQMPGRYPGVSSWKHHEFVTRAFNIQECCMSCRDRVDTFSDTTLNSFLMLTRLSMVFSICFLLRSNMHFFEQVNQRKVTAIWRRITDVSPGQRNVTNWNLMFSEFNPSFFLLLLDDKVNRWTKAEC